MTVINRSQAQAASEQIRTETTPGANTAERVGSLFRGISDSARWGDEPLTNAQFANMPPQTIKGNALATFGQVLDLTGGQVVAFLPIFTGSLRGVVPGPGSANPSLFLAANATWRTVFPAASEEGQLLVSVSNSYEPIVPSLRLTTNGPDTWRLIGTDGAIHVPVFDVDFDAPSGARYITIGGPQLGVDPNIDEIEINAKLTRIAGAIATGEQFTDYAVPNAVQNYGPAGFKSSFYCHLAGGPIVSISSSPNGPTGQIKLIHNAGGGNLTLVHNDGGVLENRIDVPGQVDLVVPPAGVVLLAYDHVATRWRPLFASAGSSSGGDVPTLDEVLAAGNATGLPIEFQGGRAFAFSPVPNFGGAYFDRNSGADWARIVIAAPDASGGGFAGGNIVLRVGNGNGAGARGYIDVESARIAALANPVNAQDAATKSYVDLAVGAGGTIPNDAVTNAILANVPPFTFKARVSAGQGDPEDITATQATALLDLFTSVLKGLVPPSGGGALNFLRADGGWAVPPGNGIPNDVSVTNAKLADGAVTNAKIFDGTITNAKFVNMNAGFKGLQSGSGAVEDLTAAQATAMLRLFDASFQGVVPASGGGTANFLRADGTFAPPPGNGVPNDGSVTAPKIADGNVNNAKLATMTTGRFKARISASTGVVEDITGTQATTMLDAFTSALKGLVPASGGGTSNFMRADGTWAVPPGSTPAAGSITNAQLASVTGPVFKGKQTGTGAPEDMTAAQATALLNVFATSLKGLVPSSPGGTAFYLRADGTWNAPPALINDGTVTNPMLFPMPEGTFKARPLGSGSGQPFDLTATQATALLDVFGGLKGLVPASLGGNTQFLRADGIWAVPAAPAVADDSITNPKLANVPTATFKGRISASDGDPEDLTATQATSLLNVFNGALKGLVPGGGSSSTFLRGDGAWATPSAGGGAVGTLDQVLANGNTTGAKSIVVSGGQAIIFEPWPGTASQYDPVLLNVYGSGQIGLSGANAKAGSLAAGGDTGLNGGGGDGTAAGGAVYINGGQGGGDGGQGGAVYINGGHGDGPAAGAVNISGGTGTGAALGGAVNIFGGEPDSGAPGQGGDVTIGAPYAQVVIQDLAAPINARDAAPKSYVDTARLSVIVPEPTTARTLVLEDSHAIIRCTNAAATSVTVPPAATVDFPIGMTIIVRQAGTGQATLVAGAGVTLNTSSTLKTAKQHASIAITKVDADEWDVTGERAAS